MGKEFYTRKGKVSGLRFAKDAETMTGMRCHCVEWFMHYLCAVIVGLSFRFLVEPRLFGTILSVFTWPFK